VGSAPAEILVGVAIDLVRFDEPFHASARDGSKEIRNSAGDL
jgi:hypothetical protein